MHSMCDIFICAAVLICMLKCCLAVDVNPQTEKYTPDYNIFHNLSRISKELAEISRKHSQYIHHIKSYKSSHGHIQHLLHVRNFSKDTSGDKKQVKVLLSYGEHAREYLSIESLFYFLHKLDEWLGHGDDIMHKGKTLWDLILNWFDLYIIVVGNPDGRAYIERTKNYCWRGTSSGVDLNRNFDWEFGGKGSSSNNKDEEYRGKFAFSEPETNIYTQLTTDIPFDAFISFHSGTKQIYIPFADTKSRQTHREPDNLPEMLKLAKLLSTSTKHPYQFGKAADLNEYSADGTVFDYMAGVRGIPFSYAIEMWGPEKYTGSSCFDLFNPRNEDLQVIVEDLFSMYTTLFSYLSTWKQTHLRLNLSVDEKAEANEYEVTAPIYSNNVHDVPSLFPMYMMLLGVILLTVIAAIHGRKQLCQCIFPRRRIISLRSLSSTFSANMFS